MSPLREKPLQRGTVRSGVVALRSCALHKEALWWEGKDLPAHTTRLRHCPSALSLERQAGTGQWACPLSREVKPGSAGRRLPKKYLQDLQGKTGLAAPPPLQPSPEPTRSWGIISYIDLDEWNGGHWERTDDI